MWLHISFILSLIVPVSDFGAPPVRGTPFDPQPSPAGRQSTTVIQRATEGSPKAARVETVQGRGRMFVSMCVSVDKERESSEMYLVCVYLG